MNCKYRKTTSSETWFWNSIFTSAPLWWNVSVHKKNKISTHAVYRFNFMLPFCQKKPQKQGFAKQKTWSLCVQLSSVQGVTSVFPLIVQDGCFCPDVQVIALRLAAELMHLSAGQSDLLGVTSKDTHTHDCHNTCQDRPRNRNLLLVRRVLLWTQ